MRSVLAIAALLALALPAAAQTTGFPGINDLTVNGINSGSTSCTFVPAMGLPMVFQVSAAPGSAVAIIIDTCPCRPGFLPLPVNLCGGAAIVQSLDLDISAGCAVIFLPGSTGSSGLFTFTLPPCPMPGRFSTQAIVVDPSCPPFLLTQAYQVSC